MQPFEWVNARSAAEAANSGATTVAAAMVASVGTQAPQDTVVIKAGGLDLLDLMKEGLMRPHRIVNLRGIVGLDGVVEEKDGTLRIGALVTIAQVASNPIVRQRYTALADATGNAASPQIRNVATLGGNLLQRPRCWYFRSVRHDCVRKGGETCFAFGGENQYHAIFDQNGCAMVHPSTAATALVALGAKVVLVNAEGQRREVLLEDFYLLPDKDIHRENDLRLGEILTAVVLPKLEPGIHSVHLKQGEKDLVRLADCRCRGAARSRRERAVPSGFDRSRSCGAGAASGEGGGGRATGKASGRTECSGCCARGTRRRRAAIKECLQAADFRDAGAARHFGRSSRVI